MGISTIQSVHHWLERGFGGYRQSLPPLIEKARRDAPRGERRLAATLPGTFTDLQGGIRGTSCF